MLSAALGLLGSAASAATVTFDDQTLPSLFSSAGNYSFRTESGNASNAALAFVGSGSSTGTTPAGVAALTTGGEVRHATTGILDLRTGGTLTFDFLFGDSTATDFGAFENADSSEDFIVAYSVDGGATFVEFARIDTEDASYMGQFGSFSALIPVLAQTASTQLSFLQVRNSGAPYDHWAIDNVSIPTPVAAVPLPAGLPLALAALGALGVNRARRQA